MVREQPLPFFPASPAPPCFPYIWAGLAPKSATRPTEMWHAGDTPRAEMWHAGSEMWHEHMFGGTHFVGGKYLAKYLVEPLDYATPLLYNDYTY